MAIRATVRDNSDVVESKLGDLVGILDKRIEEFPTVQDLAEGLFWQYEEIAEDAGISRVNAWVVICVILKMKDIAKLECIADQPIERSEHVLHFPPLLCPGMLSPPRCSHVDPNAISPRCGDADPQYLFRE